MCLMDIMRKGNSALTLEASEWRRQTIVKLYRQWRWWGAEVFGGLLEEPRSNCPDLARVKLYSTSSGAYIRKSCQGCVRGRWIG